MNRVLFVSNGHGEVAIASRIALELQARAPIPCDHLALVGDFKHPSTMRDVGPRRAMPSGGVIAMLNVRNIVRDLQAGLIPHTLAQLRFLRGVRGTYSVAVAVGDVYALVMALQSQARFTVFVGTAKSVYVAPYGAFEERIIRKADAAFVRDLPTAKRLQLHGINAHAGNAIVDLYTQDRGEIDVRFHPVLAIFPGSREPAYHDAVRLTRIARALAEREPQAGAILSIAPGIDADRMAGALEADGWPVQRSDRELQPFSLMANDREIVRAWQGPLGAMLRRADVVLGQAGTANEAAAALGIPVIAFAGGRESRTPWYRMRQIALLGDAMMVASADERRATDEVLALLHDRERRERMGHAGRQRMGEPGAAAAIAGQIAALVQR